MVVVWQWFSVTMRSRAVWPAEKSTPPAAEVSIVPWVIQAAMGWVVQVGRPKIGRGTKMVAVTIEKGLLKRADAYAKRHGIKRARMIAQGLQLVMAKA